MSKLHALKLFSKKAMVVVLPVLINLLIAYALTANADPCADPKSGGTASFVDACDD